MNATSFAFHRAAPSAEGPASGSLADGFRSYRPPDAASRTSTVDGYSAKGLMGSSLLGPDGERVAKVADLVFGPDGTVKRLVVEVGGFLGIGARRVAIDVDQLQRLPDGRASGSACSPVARRVSGVAVGTGPEGAPGCCAAATPARATRPSAAPATGPRTAPLPFRAWGRRPSSSPAA